MINSRKENTLFVEKYRPKSVDDYIGSEFFKESVNKYILENDLPNMILYGSPGRGKTTAAKLLVNNIDCDYIYLNGSDDNGIDVVRNTIKDFASAASFKPLKVVIYDDCSTLTKEAQQGLLNLIETYSKKTRFIFTTNHLEKLIEPLQSRCAVQFKIEPPSKRDVARYISDILDKEEVEYDLADVAKIIKKYYPDIRSCLIVTQQSIRDKKLLCDNILNYNRNYLVSILEILKSPTSSSWIEIREILINSDVSDYNEVYKFLYENAEEYSKDKYTDVVIAISEAQYKDYFVPDKEINVAALFLTIINNIK